MDLHSARSVRSSGEDCIKSGLLFADDLVMRAMGRDASNELAEVAESQARTECK